MIVSVQRGELMDAEYDFDRMVALVKKLSIDYIKHAPDNQGLTENGYKALHELSEMVHPEFYED